MAVKLFMLCQSTGEIVSAMPVCKKTTKHVLMTAGERMWPMNQSDICAGGRNEKRIADWKSQSPYIHSRFQYCATNDSWTVPQHGIYLVRTRNNLSSIHRFI